MKHRRRPAAPTITTGNKEKKYAPAKRSARGGGVSDRSISTGSFSLVTYGCRVNRYDAERLRADLLASGYTEARKEQADALVVVGCGVTHRAVRDARRTLSGGRRRGQRLFLAGCASRLEELSAEHPRSLITRKSPALSRFGQRCRAFLKVQNGCSHACSFCVIPRLRGPSRSRALEEVVDEAAALSRSHVELVIVGTRLGDFDAGLARLLKALLAVVPDVRFRAGSVEPDGVTPELLELMASSDRIANQLHVPFQSLSDGVLSDMNRSTGGEEALGLVRTIRERVPGIALGTDIIAGFPTETEERFEESFRRLEQAGFTSIHAFSFSPRPGTSAARMRPLHGAVVKERVNRLIALSQEGRRRALDGLVGRRVTVAVERESDGLGSGTTGEGLRASVEGAEPSSLVTGLVSATGRDYLICKREKTLCRR